jgi:nitrate reductase gamma subunit
MGFYILSYLCIAVFILAVVHLIYMHVTLPVHVRWEIYPVQHETAGKSAYGGSYMEELNWWEKKQESSLLNEVKYIVPEILLLRGLWKENKSLWLVSFPFHFGLYLMVATFGLLLLHALLIIWGCTAFASGGAFRTLMDGLIAVAGWCGLIAGNIGSIGILYKRWTNRDMRDYSSFIDYFNTLFIFLFFLAAFMTCLTGDPFLEGAKAYTIGLLTGGASLNSYEPGQNIPGILTIVLASLLFAYIPLTHMSHMFMKYFIYHRVKWDDTPNRPGSAIESAVEANLDLIPTWQAKHVGADGRKSWKDIASSAPKELK